jgi:hypothetical protein
MSGALTAARFAAPRFPKGRGDASPAMNTPGEWVTPVLGLDVAIGAPGGMAIGMAYGPLGQQGQRGGRDAGRLTP